MILIAFAGGLLSIVMLVLSVVVIVACTAALVINWPISVVPVGLVVYLMVNGLRSAIRAGRSSVVCER